MSKHCTTCGAEFPCPGDHWYMKSRSRGKIYYSCKVYEKEKAKKQCKEKKSENFKKWHNTHKEYNRERWQTYYEDNKDRLIERSKLQGREARKDPIKRMAMNLRSRIWSAIKLKSKRGSAVRDLGCTIEQFSLYIANQFQPGMSWDNYGKWHLDHVIPLVKFNLTDRQEFLEAANFLNLQPLWASDNIRKGGR